MSAQDMSAHDMSLQDWSAQDMLAQDWSAQDMSLQDWSAQDIEFQDMSDLAFAAQPVASKFVRPVIRSLERYFSSPLFGFGVLPVLTARVTVTSRTPAAFGLFGTLRAVRISAPLTGSGVQLGLRASICATVPATTGAANEVPDSWMRSLPTMFWGFRPVIVPVGGIGPTM